MRDVECVRFLQWSLPQMGLRWSGFRRVRRTVCKRLARRLRELDLADLDAYRAVLLQAPEEWTRLDGMCRIPISRFARDRAVFEALADDLLPALASDARAEGRRKLTAWSAGCASGEEPYSLAMIGDETGDIKVTAHGVHRSKIVVPFNPLQHTTIECRVVLGGDFEHPTRIPVI